VSAPTHADRHGVANAALDPEMLEVAPGTVHESVEGWVPALASENELREALEKAFDYRGDVAITKKDGSKVDGYIFDRVTGANLENSFVRVLPMPKSRHWPFPGATRRQAKAGKLGYVSIGRKRLRGKVI
jgi:hypothetical protein